MAAQMIHNLNKAWRRKLQMVGRDFAGVVWPAGGGQTGVETAGAVVMATGIGG
jgi:hypothetical protein